MSFKRNRGAYLIATRPLDDSEALSADVASRVPSVVPILCPLLEIIPLFEEKDCFEVEHVILTSRHALHALPSQRSSLSLWCVGAQTAHLAQALGYHVACTCQTAFALFEEMKTHSFEGGVIYLRGQFVQFDFEVQLQARGVKIVSQITYLQKERPLSSEAISAMVLHERCVVALYSARTARIFQENFFELPLSSQKSFMASLEVGTSALAVMSNAVGQGLCEDFRTNIVVALKPTHADMLDVIEVFLKGGASVVKRP